MKMTSSDIAGSDREGFCISPNLYTERFSIPQEDIASGLGFLDRFNEIKASGKTTLGIPINLKINNKRIL